jgi:uncharacterized RDD family membrane protein YckC
MSSTEPPAGQDPAGTTPPPPPPPAGGATPPPPPPAGAYGAPQYGAPAPGYGAPAGLPRPGELLDRFLARLLDHIICGIPAAIVVTILTIAVDSWVVSGLVAGVIYAAVFLGYFGYLESNRGATIGKSVLKLQVNGPQGGHPTMEQAIRRNIWLGAFILYIIPIFGGLFAGLIQLVAIIVCAVNINSDPQRQTWFDKFAGGTQVMKVG